MDVRAAHPAAAAATAPPAAKASPAAQALVADGVDKTYPDGTHALMPVHLEVAEGEFVTLLGPSGCGKSTLLKLVAGLLEMDGGTLRLWGRAPAELKASGRRLAFVFQSPTLMPWADVRANVRLPLELAGVAQAEADKRVDEALALVGLTKFANALPNTLSGGMQMRVSIARSLVVHPQLLLMDEPFGALDEFTRHKLDSDLLELWRSQGLTVIFVTHSISEAVFLSQRVVMMAARPGRITDEVVIDEPYPRTRDFLVTPRFAAYAKRLQDSLHRASGGHGLTDDEANEEIGGGDAPAAAGAEIKP
jgi:NitT/TauT family transport system ATP-binding protein